MEYAGNAQRLITDAVRRASEDGAIPALDYSGILDVGVERPREAAHGDYATSFALRAAKYAKMGPRDIAAVVHERIVLGEYFDSVEIAGPGFINFRLSQYALRAVVQKVHGLGADYGRSGIGTGQKVQVEFVSANPVGPMHVGHGRWAALGDSIARLLEATGYEVEREFYINDVGVQMDVFAKSVAARYLELCGRDVEFGEDWYRGAYIADIAREIYAEECAAWADTDPAEREDHFREKAYTQVLDHLRRVLHDMGVDFDVWFSERTLHAGDPGAIEETIVALRESGYVYDADGAIWFRSTDWCDDKDRVLKKADGAYTYFAADIAYHKDKFDRGFNHIIDLWGADHHGYVNRMEAAAAALGHEGDLELIIGQMVNLFRAGEIVRMSKRTGEMVTFEDLLDEVGADAARYFFLRRSTDQPLDFDIALAKERSNDNPVYYVQYAHARICSILRKAAGHETDADVDVETILPAIIREDADLSTLSEGAESDLMRKLEMFPETVEVAARLRAPSKVVTYADGLAASFHQFYTRCRVVTDDDSLTAARLCLVDATRVVLESALGVLGVSAPERM